MCFITYFLVLIRHILLHFNTCLLMFTSDVKPSNMLLGSNGQVKLCDFGISGHLVESKVFSRDAGVPAYMAVSFMESHAYHMLVMCLSHALYVFVPYSLRELQMVQLDTL